MRWLLKFCDFQNYYLGKKGDFLLKKWLRWPNLKNMTQGDLRWPKVEKVTKWSPLHLYHACSRFLQPILPFMNIVVLTHPLQSTACLNALLSQPNDYSTMSPGWPTSLENWVVRESQGISVGLERSGKVREIQKISGIEKKFHTKTWKCSICCF